MDPHQTKFQKMNYPVIIPNVTKSRSNLLSANLSRSFILPEIIPKQPSQFTSALVHEVRNPLANINLSVEVLQSAIKDNDLKIYLDIIMRSSIRINNLISDLLKHQQAYEVRSEKHSIHQLLDEVLEMAVDRIRLKKISIWKDYDTGDCK